MKKIKKFRLLIRDPELIKLKLNQEPVKLALK